MRSATIAATSVGVVPTSMPLASSASFLACAVPDEPEMIAPAWPIVLPGGAEKPAMYDEHRLRHVLADEGRGLLLLVAADLADHDDQLGLRVVLELREHVDERRADDGVAADADDRRVAEPELGQLVADLVRERARARDEADRALAEDLGGDDPDVRLARREHARAVRADHRHARGAEVRVGAEHLVHRHVLGDADHGGDARVDGLVDRVGGEARGHEDERRVRAGLSTASATVSNTGMPSTSWPPLPGVTPATTFVP